MKLNSRPTAVKTKNKKSTHLRQHVVMIVVVAVAVTTDGVLRVGVCVCRGGQQGGLRRWWGGLALRRRGIGGAVGRTGQKTASLLLGLGLGARLCSGKGKTCSRRKRRMNSILY